MSKPTSLEINLMDLEEQMRNVNLNSMVDDERWAMIIQELNSDFPIHNARPEATGAFIESAVLGRARFRLGRISKWKIIELGGVVSAVLGISYLVALVVLEVAKYIGG